MAIPFLGSFSSNLPFPAALGFTPAVRSCARVPMEHVRIDKWLWAARFFKTRTAATEAVAAGRVQVNGVSAKPSKEVHVADMIELRLGQVPWKVVVAGLADKRGPASVAATLYDETPESAENRERLALEWRQSRPLGADLGARPTKQDRRRIEALRRAQRRAPPNP
jgi:ribosome-associated heat shock protein Hsp15